MRRLLHATRHHVVRPVYHATRYMVVANIELWGKHFGEHWEILPADKKLAWILFLNQTIAILTLVELFFLKRR